MKIEYRIEHNPAKDDYRLMIKFDGEEWKEHKFRPPVGMRTATGPIPYKETFKEAAIGEVQKLLEKMRPKEDRWELVNEGWVEDVSQNEKYNPGSIEELREKFGKHFEDIDPETYRCDLYKDDNES